MTAFAWTDVTVALPDEETPVLIELNGDDSWMGFREGGVWRYPDAMPITKERVTGWAPMPAARGVAA